MPLKYLQLLYSYISEFISGLSCSMIIDLNYIISKLISLVVTEVEVQVLRNNFVNILNILMCFEENIQFPVINFVFSLDE